ncbi:MAG: DUF5659 domain-containing protein [Patescibacteria group bacterium]
MKHNTDENTYKTTDLAIAAAASLFFPIESVEKIATQRVSFVFRQTKSFSEFIDSYLRGEIRIEPQQYFNQLKVVKTRIYSSL